MKKSEKIGLAITITIALSLVITVIIGLMWLNNNNSKNKYYRDNPVKADSTFVLKLNYVNGIEEIEEFILPSDAVLEVSSSGSIYYLRYHYNIDIQHNSYSLKEIKRGVVNFKHVTNERENNNK